MTTPVSGVIAILATVDTKAAEAGLLKAELGAHGLRATIVDVGVRPAAGADVPAREVARAGDHDIAELAGVRRDTAMHAMAVGAGRLLRRWQDAGYLLGVLGVGGNQGTSIAATAMRELPIGLPKLIVSTVASGNVRGFVGDSDIVMMFSVADLLGGPNIVTSGVLRRAAGALAGMIGTTDATSYGAARPQIAVTAFGNTHAAVTCAIAHLNRAGYDTVPFHASGASGSAMERLIDAGMFAGVLDLTTHELLAELFPADIYTPVRPGRLTAAGRAGIPQVVAPGGLEYHCFAAADTIPSALRDRAVHHHNPNNTNVRATAEELTRVAAALAERLNGAAGPVTVLVPGRGWSEVGSPGGVLHDPAANRAFTDTLRGALGDHVTLRELDLTINDPGFAAAASAALLDHLAAPAPHSVRISRR
ncbi:MAG TPA: Tm-1-like ATP-binding domain-containing protein [Streptosporangiaceae bacterium]|jgi:uncharacterized protein (UPF0261 family)